MRPFAICFTGTSGSGKSTLAYAVADALKDDLPLQIIDGDVLRSELGHLFWLYKRGTDETEPGGKGFGEIPLLHRMTR